MSRTTSWVDNPVSNAVRALQNFSSHRSIGLSGAITEGMVAEAESGLHRAYARLAIAEWPTVAQMLEELLASDVLEELHRACATSTDLNDAVSDASGGVA